MDEITRDANYGTILWSAYHIQYVPHVREPSIVAIDVERVRGIIHVQEEVERYQLPPRHEQAAELRGHGTRRQKHVGQNLSIFYLFIGFGRKSTKAGNIWGDGREGGCGYWGGRGGGACQSQ